MYNVSHDARLIASLYSGAVAAYRLLGLLIVIVVILLGDQGRLTAEAIPVRLRGW